MKIKIALIFCIGLILSGCVGVSSTGIFGTGVSVAIDPRSLGTQIDDSIMQKNLSTRILLVNKNYFLSVIKATNYQIDTYKKKIYIYGIATTNEEKDTVIEEANKILDVENVIASILLVDNLRIQKN